METIDASAIEVLSPLDGISPMAMEIYQRLPTEIQRRPNVLTGLSSMDEGELQQVAHHYQLNVGPTYNVTPVISPQFTPHFNPTITVQPRIYVDTSASSSGDSGDVGKFGFFLAFILVLIALASSMGGGD